MSLDIRESIRAFISDKGFSQAAIAKKANMNPSKLSMTLNKNRKLEANELFSLCDALGATPDELRRYLVGELPDAEEVG